MQVCTCSRVCVRASARPATALERCNIIKWRDDLVIPITEQLFAYVACQGASTRRTSSKGNTRSLSCKYMTYFSSESAWRALVSPPHGMLCPSLAKILSSTVVFRISKIYPDYLEPNLLWCFRQFHSHAVLWERYSWRDFLFKMRNGSQDVCTGSTKNNFFAEIPPYW
jgi:hypothetical protein